MTMLPLLQLLVHALGVDGQDARLLWTRVGPDARLRRR